MIVTLNEKRTLSSGYYLFVFTHMETKAVVNKIYNFSEDESPYPTRYNSFPIVPAVAFLNKPGGDYLYNIYEQASSSNTSVTGLTEVERGIMTLALASEFEFDQYETTTTYKSYAG